MTKNYVVTCISLTPEEKEWVKENKNFSPTYIIKEEIKRIKEFQKNVKHDEKVRDALVKEIQKLHEEIDELKKRLGENV